MKDIKNILAMGNLIWCLKVYYIKYIEKSEKQMELERANNVLKAMKEEHKSCEEC